MRLKNGQELGTGILFIAIGMMALWIGAGYSMGTAQRPGTGVLPRILSWCLIGTGAVILVQALLADAGEFARGIGRAALVVVVTGAVTFAILISGLIHPVWSIVPLCLGAAALLDALGLGVAWRPFLAVALATVAFGLMIDGFGLVVTMIVALTICALGTSETRWPEYLAFLAIMITIGWGVFIWLLGMPISPWPTKLPAFLGR